jgi:hypothetical protein
MDVSKYVAGAVVLGIIIFAFNLHSRLDSMDSRIAATDKDVSAAKQDSSTNLNHLKELLISENVHLKEKIDHLENAITKRLAADTDRSGQYYVAFDECHDRYHEQSDPIAEIDKDHVILERKQKGVPLKTSYRIADGIRVIIDGKDGKLKDLKAGDYVTVIHSGDLAQLIEKWTPPPPKTDKADKTESGFVPAPKP